MNFNPEHIHVMLNHLPLIGMALALLPLLVGLVGRRRESLCIGLVLAALCGAATFVVMESGERAEHEWLESDAAAHLDADALAWAEVHEERAEDFVWVMYGTVAMAVLGLATFGVKKWRKLNWTLGVLTSVGCVLSVAACVWIADVGGKINHPEFRTGPPPTLDADHHH